MGYIGAAILSIKILAIVFVVYKLSGLNTDKINNFFNQN
jgi:hypothetical protein